LFRRPPPLLPPPPPLEFFELANCDTKSIGTGNMIVEFFSAAIEFRVCRYLSCKADGDSSMILEASLSALDALISPSAAMTLALASRDASASAAIALCNCSGNRASLISTLSTLMPHGSVASSNALCIACDILSLSLSISWSGFVPRIFLSVVCASNRVEWWAFSTLATDTVALDTL